jgi:hypothetical protein
MQAWPSIFFSQDEILRSPPPHLLLQYLLRKERSCRPNLTSQFNLIAKLQLCIPLITVQVSGWNFPSLCCGCLAWCPAARIDLQNWHWKKKKLAIYFPKW